MAAPARHAWRHRLQSASRCHRIRPGILGCRQLLPGPASGGGFPQRSLGKAHGVCASQWTPELRLGYGISKVWEVLVLRHHPGWVQPHLSHTGHPGCHGVGGGPAGSLCPVPHRGGGMRMQPIPTQRWQSTARPLHAGLCSHPRAKPPPAWVPQLQRALSTYQPTHSSAATSQRRSQASRFSGSHVEKATWHISGGEGCRQDPEQAWSEKTSPLGTGESHTPLDHRHWGLCRGFAPSPVLKTAPEPHAGNSGSAGGWNPSGSACGPWHDGHRDAPRPWSSAAASSRGECCTLPLLIKALLSSSFSAHNSFPAAAAGLLAGSLPAALQGVPLRSPVGLQLFIKSLFGAAT